LVVSTVYVTPSDVISVVYSTVIDVESSITTPVFTDFETTQLPDVTVTTTIATPSSLVITVVTLPTPTCKFDNLRSQPSRERMRDLYLPVLHANEYDQNQPQAPVPP
jgi:hypothetical protein